MGKDPPIPRRRPSPKMNKPRAAFAKFLVQKIGLYQHQAAAILGVNQGRVSEVMTGKCHDGIPPSDKPPEDDRQQELGI